MIKKSVFERELIDGMHQYLVKQVTNYDTNSLSNAIDLLNSSAEMFEDLGMIKNSEEVLKIIIKIANKFKDPRKISDKHTKNLTSNNMISNLKDHGTVFNMANDGKDSIFEMDINDALEVDDTLEAEINDFEDELSDVKIASYESLDGDIKKEIHENKRKRFIRQVIRELVHNTDDYEWTKIELRHLLPYINFNISPDENMLKITRQGLTPFSFKVHG